MEMFRKHKARPVKKKYLKPRISAKGSSHPVFRFVPIAYKYACLIKGRFYYELNGRQTKLYLTKDVCWFLNYVENLFDMSPEEVSEFFPNNIRCYSIIAAINKRWKDDSFDETLGLVLTRFYTRDNQARFNWATLKQVGLCTRKQPHYMLFVPSHYTDTNL